MQVSQQKIDTTVTAEQAAAINTALDTIEPLLAFIPPLTSSSRLRLLKMGFKSEAFVRESLAVLKSYPGAFPADLDPDTMDRDFAVRDLLVPVQIRLQAMLRRVQDGNIAAGSDLMNGAMVIYRSLKSHAEPSGLKEAKDSLRRRFAQVPQAPEAPTEPEPSNPQP